MAKLTSSTRSSIRKVKTKTGTKIVRVKAHTNKINRKTKKR